MNNLTEKQTPDLSTVDAVMKAFKGDAASMLAYLMENSTGFTFSLAATVGDLARAITQIPKA